MPDAASFQFAGQVAFVGAGVGWLLTLLCLWDRFDRSKDPKFIHITKDVFNATVTAAAFFAVFSIAINVAVRLPALEESQRVLLTDIQSRVSDLQGRVETPAAVDLAPLTVEARRIAAAIEEMQPAEVDLGLLAREVARVAGAVERIMELSEEPCPSLVDEIAEAYSPENSRRVPIRVQTQEPPCGTSAVLTTTCATTEALA